MTVDDPVMQGRLSLRTGQGTSTELRSTQLRQIRTTVYELTVCSQRCIIISCIKPTVASHSQPRIGRYGAA